MPTKFVLNTTSAKCDSPVLQFYMSAWLWRMKEITTLCPYFQADTVNLFWIGYKNNLDFQYVIIGVHNSLYFGGDCFSPLPYDIFVILHW